MNKVIFPLKKSDKGSEVANLQDALKLMLEREAIYPGNPRARAALLAKLPSERQIQTYGTITLKTVKIFQEEQHLRPDGTVGSQIAEAINTLLKEWGVHIEGSLPEPDEPDYRVSGIVYEAPPLEGVLVQAFDKDLRHEQFLGESLIRRSGRYEIIFFEASFRRAEKEGPDLLVKVLGADGSILYSSSVIYNAKKDEFVDLIFSEYDRLNVELTPSLDYVPLAELTDKDIDFLANETGIELLLINLLSSAAKLASLTNLAIDVHYGLLREGLSAELPLLLQEGRESQRNALESAIEKEIIVPLSPKKLNAILNRLEEMS